MDTQLSLKNSAPVKVTLDIFEERDQFHRDNPCKATHLDYGSAEWKKEFGGFLDKYEAFLSAYPPHTPAKQTSGIGRDLTYNTVGDELQRIVRARQTHQLN